LRNIDAAKVYSTTDLYEKVKIDELYFLATGGGVCFGGGEPSLRYEFIQEFRDICGPDWKLTIETALNVPKKNIEALLPVIDNFDRALENQTDDVEVYRKGVEMTITQLKEILKNMEVESFGAVGDEFDPNIHSAVMTVENDELPENSVAAVFEKGYKMGDRILRFATVQVTN
jgi:organic radical activating enzyme